MKFDQKKFDLKTAIIGLVFILLIFCSEKKAVPAGSECKDEAMTILSFNIRFGTAQDEENSWKFRKEMVFDLLQEQKAEIVALQEALHFQITEIIQSLSGYKYIGVGRDNGDTLGEYSAILYKDKIFRVLDQGTFWLSDHPDQIASIDWGNACTRICTWSHFQQLNTGQKFYVYNLHLDHVSQISREKSIELLKQKIAEQSNTSPLIITGDFNAGELNPAIINLKKGLPKNANQQGIKIIDSFRDVFPQAENVGTFHAFKGQSTRDKIDYIFVDHHFKILDAAIIKTNKSGRYPSDHFPVMAKLCL